MEVKKHRRLTLKERVIIQTLLREKKSKSYIEIRLGRSRSTIGREVNKWIQRKIFMILNLLIGTPKKTT